MAFASMIRAPPTARRCSAIVGERHRAHRGAARPAIDALWQRRDGRGGEHHHPAWRHAGRALTPRAALRHLAGQWRCQRHGRPARLRRRGELLRHPAASRPRDVRPMSTELATAIANVGATANRALACRRGAQPRSARLLPASRVGIADTRRPITVSGRTPEFARDDLMAGYAASEPVAARRALTQRLAVIGSDSDRRYYGIYDPYTSNVAV